MSRDAKVFKTSQLPKQPGVSGWVAMLPARAGQPSLKEEITADIAVIGAGFAGLSAARRLSQIDPTLRIAVLEAGVVGEGPAGRAERLLQLSSVEADLAKRRLKAVELDLRYKDLVIARLP